MLKRNIEVREGFVIALRGRRPNRYVIVMFRGREEEELPECTLRSKISSCGQEIVPLDEAAPVLMKMQGTVRAVRTHTADGCTTTDWVFL